MISKLREQLFEARQKHSAGPVQDENVTLALYLAGMYGYRETKEKRIMRSAHDKGKKQWNMITIVTRVGVEVETGNKPASEREL